MTAPNTVQASSSLNASTLLPIEMAFGDFAGEFASTRRVLERYPEASGAWRPHEKSRSLSEVATHVADIVNRGTSIRTTPGMDMATRTPVAPLDSAGELLALFDGGVARFQEAMRSATSDALKEVWTLRAGPRVVLERQKGELLRFMMMSHMIHHRAQLGVYYRLLGVPVPGVYGPSADE
ncbi:MAG: DinB family protein [Gemmatimonadaceae bacterium]